MQVVIADDHHHVLPAIHKAIRRRRLPFTGIHIIHIDAHPDLSFSNELDPTAVIFDAEVLYDALDASTSGIAEFLLPLIYAGHVNTLSWIKSPWSQQMVPMPFTRIAIGKHMTTDRLVVSSPLPHFIEDDLYAPEEMMEPQSIKHWDLSVMEMHSNTILIGQNPWVLDIDLDYFTTWNPFRCQLQAANLNESDINLLENVFVAGPRFKDIQNSSFTPEQRNSERQSFDSAMKTLENMEDTSSIVAQEHVITSLIPLYTDSSAAKVLLTSFLQLLAKLDQEREKTTLELIWKASPFLDLPHYEANESEVMELIHGFHCFLTNQPRPTLVTIATSVSDAFLPPHQLNFVQSSVLRVLEQVYGDLEIETIEYEPV